MQFYFIPKGTQIIMNTSTEKATLDLGAMLEESLDNIPEAPDFQLPPAGEYRLSVVDAKIDYYETKKEPGVEKQRLKIIYSVDATVAVSAASKEPPVPDGSLFRETFQATEEGLGYFKKRIKDVMNVSDLFGVSLKEMMESVKGVGFDARITIKTTANPNDKDNPYQNVNVKVVPPKA